jgi:hypothetical protein
MKIDDEFTAGLPVERVGGSPLPVVLVIVVAPIGYLVVR